jgi:CheY-like chemotaxis protein
LTKPAEVENLSLPDDRLSVGFIGFRPDGRVCSTAFEGRDGIIKENIMKSVADCMVDWLQMEPYPEPDAQVHDADYVVILVDDRITDFIRPYVDGVRQQQPRVIALLASEMSRRDVDKVLGQSIHAFEVMSAPFGPRKMARAVAACEKAAANWQGHYRRPPPLTTLEKLKTIQPDLDVRSYLLERKGLAVRPKTTVDRASLSTNVVRVADTKQQEDKPSNHEEASAKETFPPGSHPAEHSSRRTRLLLVDDNAINLRLLETFVRKRKCDYSCAENGLIAVDAFRDVQQQPDSGYGIIFMDISMPVMDGLEATREIRKLEQKQREEYKKGSKDAPAPQPALIVALTGLANSQDQANAFASGVDLFMTKPIKFKQIGRLLDDWFDDRDVTAGGDKTASIDG